MSLPLNKQIQLSHEDEAAFVSRAQQLLKQALNTTPVMPPSTEKLGFRVYKFILKKEYFCTGNMDGNLDDIKYALYADNTTDAKNVAGITFGKYYQDAGVLQVLQQRSQQDSFQFLGVKYIQLAKTNVFMKSKDPVVYLECCGTYIDKKTGQSILYQILDWIDMEHYSAPQNTWEKAIKSTGSMINLFRMETPTTIGIFSSTLYEADIPVYLSRINTGSSYCDFFSRLSSLPVSRRLLDSSPIVQHWVPDSKICSVCQSPFKTLRPKHNCRACGDIMCSNCTHYVQSPTTLNKYCKKCVVEARQCGDYPSLIEQEPSPMSVDESTPALLYLTNEVDNPISQIEKKLSEQNTILSAMRIVLEQRAQSAHSLTATDIDSCVNFDPDALLAFDDIEASDAEEYLTE
ncbi:hypothetical protein THRCLA_05533 [Thraustotheca clavata]|uniref:FYVE-type domain-containing protein n=1 Tax=Thraustotheca clavata TaxID=74557 RepID=A0A1V9ZVP3_9STRA|nr:hypothetical protein THRCLA_05533 [Thraustotheca clavata]